MSPAQEKENESADANKQMIPPLLTTLAGVGGVGVVFMVSPVLRPPACFPGTFKSKLGEGSCVPCPANSHSSARGASICPCQGGFHRADSDPPESVCTSKSSPGGREGKKDERKKER